MKLEQQFQLLLDEAPQHGVPTLVMQEAVIPALKQLAKRLRHANYYVIQTAGGDWVLTVLLHREKPQPEKKVIYAFASREDAAKFCEINEQISQVVKIPLANLLFELFAWEPVDSIIFMDTPGNQKQGKEMPRSALQAMIQEGLKNLPPPRQRRSRQMPPDIA
ncbi:MAG: hypothetical protein ACKO2V_00040 [Snowella sp.]